MIESLLKNFGRWAKDRKHEPCEMCKSLEHLYTFDPSRPYPNVHHINTINLLDAEKANLIIYQLPPDTRDIIYAWYVLYPTSSKNEVRKFLGYHSEKEFIEAMNTARVLFAKGWANYEYRRAA